MSNLTRVVYRGIGLEWVDPAKVTVLQNGNELGKGLTLKQALELVNGKVAMQEPLPVKTKGWFFRESFGRIAFPMEVVALHKNRRKADGTPGGHHYTVKSKEAAVGIATSDELFLEYKDVELWMQQFPVYTVTFGSAGKTDEFSSRDWINFHARIECIGTMNQANKEQANLLFAEFVKNLQNL